MARDPKLQYSSERVLAIAVRGAQCWAGSAVVSTLSDYLGVTQEKCGLSVTNKGEDAAAQTSDLLAFRNTSVRACPLPAASSFCLALLFCLPE